MNKTNLLEKLKVKKKNLLLIAAIVWLFAGYNVLRIGFLAYSPYLGILNFLLSLIVFIIFQQMIFGKLVKKHTKRIENFQEEKQFFYKFFDKKSFIIMAIMIFGGIGLRYSGLLPERFIAVFYTGLGSALFLAGILFFVNYTKSFKIL